MAFEFNYNPILKINEVCKEGTGKVIVLQLMRNRGLEAKPPPT